MSVTHWQASGTKRKRHYGNTLSLSGVEHPAHSREGMLIDILGQFLIFSQ